MFIVLPFIESFTKVDMRSKILDIPRQEVITKDSVTASVDAVVYYRITDPLASIVNVQNPQKATGRLAQVTLTRMIGTTELRELLSSKDTMSKDIQAVLDVATVPWGIKVERVEIEDVSLPDELTRVMAAEAEASREAKAKLIKAEGEIKSARFLQKASAELDSSPYAMQLKYLQTLSSVAKGKESTIVFPFPIDIDFSELGLQNFES
jgi:erythrocyte band 7 integral membrane protein